MQPKRVNTHTAHIWTMLILMGLLVQNMALVQAFAHTETVFVTRTLAGPADFTGNTETIFVDGMQPPRLLCITIHNTGALDINLLILNQADQEIASIEEIKSNESRALCNTGSKVKVECQTTGGICSYRWWVNDGR